MRIIIVAENPHDPKNPTCVGNDTCKTLDEAVQAVWFFMEYFNVIKVSVEEKPCVSRVS